MHLFQKEIALADAYLAFTNVEKRTRYIRAELEDM